MFDTHTTKLLTKYRYLWQSNPLWLANLPGVAVGERSTWISRALSALEPAQPDFSQWGAAA